MIDGGVPQCVCGTEGVRFERQEAPPGAGVRPALTPSGLRLPACF